MTDRSNADLVFRDVSSLLENGKTELLFTPLLQGEGKKRLCFINFGFLKVLENPFVLSGIYKKGKNASPHVFPEHIFLPDSCFCGNTHVYCLIVLVLKLLTMWNIKYSCSNKEASPNTTIKNCVCVCCDG